MKIIINADDLGYSETVNNAIISLIERKKITSTTIIANAPSFNDAINKIVSVKECSIGVHLNITKFKPLTIQKEFYDYRITDSNGNFNGKLRNRYLSKKIIKAIEIEWKSQVDKVRKHGIEISHLDSHHHVHTIPKLFYSLKRVQKEFGIKKVRISNNIYVPGYNISNIRLKEKLLWNFFLRNCYKTKTTDYFTLAEWFLDNINMFKNISNKTVELMCHPGRKKMEKYTKMLYEDWAENASYVIHMISYKEL
jgi:predicted glycoside hydrolase/deacetylase ChbG (UPF0249 family)